MEALSKHPEVVCTELEDGAVLLNLETAFITVSTGWAWISGI